MEDINKDGTIIISEVNSDKYHTIMNTIEQSITPTSFGSIDIIYSKADKISWHYYILGFIEDGKIEFKPEYKEVSKFLKNAIPETLSMVYDPATDYTVYKLYLHDDKVEEFLNNIIYSKEGK